jgi:FlaA1/EpsC-like NDP-sugar epimerase
MYRPTTIIIAAALKQVDTCELSPSESVMTNLQGTQNVINAANSMSEWTDTLKSILFVSTDKACSPVNVYGMCKAISERIVTSQARTGSFNIRYLAVRYGNVLESRGSIVPLFKYQGMHGDFLTVTDPDMTRFLMTLDDSVDLIERALQEGMSGETWIPRLSSMRIGDLAQIFADHYKKSINYIGLRPGEKRDEDLINESESVRLHRFTDDKKYYVLGPAFESGKNSTFVYSSNHNVMSRQELELYIAKLGIINAPLNQFTGLAIEEIATNRKA